MSSRMSSTTPSKMTPSSKNSKTLVTVADGMLKNLGMSPLTPPSSTASAPSVDLADHAEHVLSLWANGKIIEKDSAVITDEQYAKHDLERELIKTASFNKHELPSVYTITTDGTVELDLPIHAPSWAKAQQLGDAKNFQRYSRVARRLQQKLAERGVPREEMNLKRFW